MRMGIRILRPGFRPRRALTFVVMMPIVLHPNYSHRIQVATAVEAMDSGGAQRLLTASKITQVM